MENTCFSVAELQKRLGLSKSGAFQLVNRADFFPAFRIGRRWLINAAKFERWLDEQTH